MKRPIYYILLFLLLPSMLLAQEQTPNDVSLWSSPGVLITIVLIAMPVILGIIILMMKSYRIAKRIRNDETLKQAKILAEEIVRNKDSLNPEQIAEKKRRLEYELTNAELSGNHPAEDVRGLIQNPTNELINSFFSKKTQPPKRPKIDKNLTKLVLWFLGSAIFWLLLGTSVGEYLGIKFIVPDADTVSWLSFGRLRPVHTNLVFWGWSSLAMLGLGYYAVPRVGNTSIASLKMGWYSLWFINASHIIGTLSLMAGFNNGGGEYREYLWPIMLLFVIGLLLSLINYYKTVAIRKTKEIYISNWYIIAAVIFINVIAIVAYLPFWQDGLGETIIQGYYMHQAVGLWFMMFVLGLLYYFLPQQLNKPIYSYSLGILAFWTQILFYTLIGTHHFVFSALPWWLQTVAIVGSVGMLIPVAAGTINFLMTFKGSWNKVSSSYSLPFFLVGVVYYFTGSFQGTAEAFRFTNLLWHFTDFTIAHSHITMYGIITFVLFAGVYAIVPRLTGKNHLNYG